MSETQGPYGAPYKRPNCIFCSEEIATRIAATHSSLFAIGDKYPVTQGHLLIIPYRHSEDYFSMTSEERLHVEKLMRQLKGKVLLEDPSIKGFNIGMNCGEVAGQTVMHAPHTPDSEERGRYA